MLAAGDKLPAIALQDSSGAPLDLAQFRGKPLVVYFYPKADTPGCTTEAKDFTDLADAFAGAGVPIVAVSKDKPAKLAKFAEKHGLKVILASDEQGGFCEAFGTWAEKKNYGKTYMGIVRSTFLVDGEGNIVRAWPSVKVKGHAQDVLEAVKAL